MRLNDLFEETPIDEKYRPLYEKALKVFEAPAAEAALTDMLGTIQDLKNKGQIDPKVAAPVFDAIKKAFAKAERSFYGQMGRRKQQTTKAVRGEVEKEYQEFHAELQDVLDKIAKKIDGYKDDPQEKRTAKQQATAMARLAQIKDSIDSLFVDPNVLNPETRDGRFSREDILGFLKACLEGEVLNMNDLVEAENGTGYIQDFVKEDYLPMYNFLIEKGLLQLTMAGTTGGNVGPGEFALAMIGSPAEKGKKGDLQIDGVEYELKAGNYGKMKSGRKATSTGGRMNSGLINTGRAAGNLIVSGIKKYIPDWGSPAFKKWTTANIKPQLSAPGLPGLGARGVQDWNKIFKAFNVSGDNVEGLLSLILRSIISNIDDVVKAIPFSINFSNKFYG